MSTVPPPSEFWISSPCDLVSSLQILPFSFGNTDLSNNDKLNAVSRLILIIFAVMVLAKFKFSVHFLALGMIFIVITYLVVSKKTSKVEGYSNLRSERVAVKKKGKSCVNDRFHDEFVKLSRDTDCLNVPKGKFVEQLTEESFKGGTCTSTNPYNIPCATVHLGLNPRSFIPPVIAPRLADQDYWSYSTVRPVNYNPVFDVTEQSKGTIVDKDNNYTDIDTLMTTARELNCLLPLRPPTNKVTSFPLREGYTDIRPTPFESSLSTYIRPPDPRPYDGVISDPYENTTIPGGACLGPPPSDFDRNYSVNYPPYPNTEMGEIIRREQLNGKFSPQPSREERREVEGFSNLVDTGFPSQLSEGGFFSASTRTADPYTDLTVLMGEDTPLTYKRKTNSDQSDLFKPSPTRVYTEEELNTPGNRVFLQDIQPNLYSFSYEQTPINANLGVSYTPQIPPKFMDQACTKFGTFPVITRGDPTRESSYYQLPLIDGVSDPELLKPQPLYTRNDPQLIRDDEMPGRMIENPTRTAWSARYSDWEAQNGTVDYRKADPYSSVYDPRFSGYGDPYRSYADVNLGQVQYYYSDIDALRRPNFIIRNKVDHMDFTNPMDKTTPEYISDIYPNNVGLDELKATVEDQFANDQIFHRSDIMESQMRKRNSEMWQLRYAPVRGQNNAQTLHSGF